MRLLKQMSMEMKLNFMLNQVITCLSSLQLVWPHQGLQEAKPAGNYPPLLKKLGGREGFWGEENGAGVLGRRERIAFCRFNSPKWFVQEVKGKLGHTQWREWNCRART